MVSGVGTFDTEAADRENSDVSEDDLDDFSFDAIFAAKSCESSDGLAGCCCSGGRKSYMLFTPFDTKTSSSSSPSLNERRPGFLR